MASVESYVFHAYVFGTSFWYFLRGFMRVVDPVTVIGWFRPPVDQLLTANDLEIYTTRTDAYGLFSLAAILLVLADALPLPKTLVGSSFTAPSSEKARKPYARAVILVTLFHHITTGIGSYSHWIRESHRTIAMDIGVFGNIGLTTLGVVALVLMEDGLVAKATPKKTK